MKIEERITELRIELFTLSRCHDDMIAENQRMNQEFQKRVADNQARFQQINGAIIELEAIQKDGEDKPDGKRSK
jgi:hypothetical protein